jgi:hypothetical protein
MAIIRITISGIYYQQRCQNVLHFRQADYVDSLLDPFLIDIRDVWVEQQRFLQNIGYQYTTIVGQKVSPPADLAHLLDISTKTGTNTGAGAVSTISLLWTFRTADPTHRGRGRMYLGGVHGQTPLNGLVHPTIVSSMGTVATAWMNRYGPSGTSAFDLVVGPHGNHPDSDYREVTSVVARSYFGVQRRRNIGVGV